MIRFDSLKTGAELLRQVCVAAVLAVLLVPARAAIIGEMGQTFALTASDGYVSVADGGSIYSWGYSMTGAPNMQFPGPTLIVTQGQLVTITLTNDLPPAAGNASIVFPGQQVTATLGDADGLLTREASPGSTVTYTFTPDKPGTYLYHSGTRPDLQVEMGLYGALIVRPSTTDVSDCVGGSKKAYDNPNACYDREYLFLESEIDIDIHRAAELQKGGLGPIDIGNIAYRPEYWLFNGRTAPDTMAEAGDGLLPTQPYNTLPKMYPGERLLMRVVGAGRDTHPFHHHGNHARIIARDGNLLVSETPGSTKLAGPLVFTIPTIPGGTVDAVFEWTGKDLGWDIYGTAAEGRAHDCVDNDGDGYGDVLYGSTYAHEYCPDHDKQIPVKLPDLTNLTFGGFWSGSPYLGALGSLPPGEGGLNPEAGFTYMWHSHTERELVNNDVFPGGMMTMLIIVSPLTDPPLPAE